MALGPTLALWYADRVSAAVLYPVLWAAVLTGAARRLGALPRLRDASRRHHVRVSTVAVWLVALHAVLGSADALLVFGGRAPMPAYGPSVLLAGVVLGAVATLVTAVAVLGFTDPRRFGRPTLVHALAYLGFAVGTVHALLVGTDVSQVVVQALTGALGLLVFLLAARLFDGLAPAASAQ